MAPVARALTARPALHLRLLLTGQHRGLAGFWEGIDPAAVTELPFDPRGRSAVRLREALHRLLCAHLARDRPELVLVHGDTTSALAAAFAARDCGIAVGHVEAGLRSFDLKRPWPEEGNRVAIDALSSLLFAPTSRAAANLRRDHRVTGEVHITGNTGIDALLAAGAPAALAPPSPPDRRRPVLVTCHRKENQGEAAAKVCESLRRLVSELPVAIDLPLHPNPQVRSTIEAELQGHPDVRLHPPLGHPEMVALMKRCWIILTDSGGLQEEGPALGKPVLVLRSVTERPEALDSGNIELVGTQPARIVAAVRSLLADPAKFARMSRPCSAFGDGQAAPRVATLVEAWLARPPS